MATKDDFGNLSDWGRVLSTLEELRAQGLLDEHQAGLARLVRHRANWRLREAALLRCVEIERASEILIADVLNTLVDENTPLELRVLAAKALQHLIPRYVPQPGSSFDIRRVVEIVQKLAARPQPPVLAEAVDEAIKAWFPSSSIGRERCEVAGR